MLDNLNNKLYVARIIKNTIVDGEGFRSSLYLSGCDIFCEDCHNKELWDISAGVERSIKDVYDELTASFTDITFIGGEPMMQSENLAVLANLIKENSNKTIWIYSGHTFEEILSNEKYFNLLKFCDVLVDGKYDKNYHVNNLKFRGSTNQRIIDIQKSLKAKEIVLWEDSFCID